VSPGPVPPRAPAGYQAASVAPPDAPAAPTAMTPPVHPQGVPTAAQLRRSDAPSGSVTVTPPPAARPPGPRKARVYVTRVDPWSVMKAGFMLSLVIAIIVVVMVAGLWWVLDVTGVFEALARNVDEIVGGGTATFDLENLLGFQRVMGVAVVIAAMEIVLVSILATLFAFGYNLTVGITGGIEVTLSDE
jgi:hypothetical protein